MQIVYTVSTQLIVDVNEELTEEEILEMSEQEIINVMTDIMYQGDGELGELSNQHGKVEFELLNDEDESVRYFEKYGDN